MKQNSFSKKRIIHLSVVVFVVVIIILIAVFLMFKYHVEGEKNLPFKLSSINIISTAESKLSQDEEEIWHAGILQKNDIYFLIEKSSTYNKQDAIKSISFENFAITKENENIIAEIYRPTTSISTYNYTEEYKIENSLKFEGAQNTNIETLQINNQGGLIGFSVTLDNLGEYIFDTNEKVPSDGTLLAKAGIKEEDIKFKISFDLIIETESENKFKANIILDLPIGNITKNGVETMQDTELNNIIFKRF